jgi:hypothetical protein
LITKALSLDVKSKNNHWQQIFIQEGMEMLNKPDNKLVQFLQGITSGLGKQGINKIGEFLSKESGGAFNPALLNHAFTAGSMVKTLTEIMNMTDDFWEKFAHKIKVKYGEDIDKASQAQAEQETGKEKEKQLTNEAVVQVSAPPEIEEREIEVTRVGSDTYHSSKAPATGGQLREHHYYGAASTHGSLTKVFGGNLKAKITNKIQGELIQPVTGSLISMGIEKVSEGLTENVNAALAGFKAQRNTYTLGNQVATMEQNEKKEGEATTKKLDPHSQEKTQAIAEGKRGDITDVALLAKTVKRPIIIYKDGEVFDIIGKDLPGEPIALSHSSAGVGHWEPIDKTIRINVSGENNCLYDAIVAQLPVAERKSLGVKNGQDLRPHVVKEIQNNPAISQKFMAQAAQLSYLKPAAMMEGGRRYRVNIGDNATPGSKYRTEYVNEDGGNERDYIEYGDYDDKGNFIPVREDGKEKVEVIEREDGSIIMIRFKETEKSTVSALLIPGNSKEEDIQGYGLEPKGPSTAEREINQRILAQTYNLKPHGGTMYKDTYRLWNDQLDADARILIHSGNNYTFTKGCIMFSDTYRENAVVQDKNGKIIKDKYGNPERDNVLNFPSKTKVEAIKNFIKTQGYKNVKVHILEKINIKNEKQEEAEEEKNSKLKLLKYVI